ncbi:hypothetical protein DSECCO2_563070 [anaerobic digester metagenome]
MQDVEQGLADEGLADGAQARGAGVVDVEEDAVLIHEQEGLGGRVDEGAGLGLAVADLGLGQAALLDLEEQVAGAAFDLDLQARPGLAQVALGADALTDLALEFVVGRAQMLRARPDRLLQLLLVAAQHRLGLLTAAHGADEHGHGGQEHGHADSGRPDVALVDLVEAGRLVQDQAALGQQGFGDAEAPQLDMVEDEARRRQRVHGDGVGVCPVQDAHGQPGHAFALGPALDHASAHAARAHLEVPEAVDGHLGVGRKEEVLAAVVHEHAFLVAHDAMHEDDLPGAELRQARAQFLGRQVVPVGEADAGELRLQGAQGLVREQVGDGLVRADDNELACSRMQAQGRAHGFGEGRVFGQARDEGLAAQLLGAEVVDAAEDHGRAAEDAVAVFENEVQGVVVRGHDEIEDALGQLVPEQGGLQGQVGRVGVALGVQVLDPQQGLGHFRAEGLLDAGVEGVGPGQAGVVGVQQEHVLRPGLRRGGGQKQQQGKQQGDDDTRHVAGVCPNGAAFKPVRERP